MAGETGGLYRALGWRPGVNRHGKWRYALVERGKVRSDRAIYRRRGSHAAAREPGAIHRAAACQGRLGMASAMNLAHDFSGYSAVYTVTVPSAAQSASSLPTMLLARMLIIEPSGEKKSASGPSSTENGPCATVATCEAKAAFSPYLDP
jgi:hypothetical protein